MSDVARLIEKLALAVHGERPELVLSVLVSFVKEICESNGLRVEEFINALREQEGIPPEVDLDPGDESS